MSADVPVPSRSSAHGQARTSSRPASDAHPRRHSGRRGDACGRRALFAASAVARRAADSVTHHQADFSGGGLRRRRVLRRQRCCVRAEDTCGLPGGTAIADPAASSYDRRRAALTCERHQRRRLRCSRRAQPTDRNPWAVHQAVDVRVRHRTAGRGLCRDAGCQAHLGDHSWADHHSTTPTRHRQTAQRKARP